MNAIEVSKLKRIYKTTLGVFKRKTKTVNAVDGVSFDVNSGELFGLLGPNGAGKTTTVKILTTLLIPTSESARILGMDIVKNANKIRSHIGRAFIHILDGMLGVFIGLTWGIILFGLNLSHTDFGALILTIFITTFSTAGLGLLMGCLSLITRNVMFVNNTVYFLLLIFSGANIDIATLPTWMRVISNILPLTRGVSSARQIINGGNLASVAQLLIQELLIGFVYVLLGYFTFRWFEIEAKRRGTLEVF